jgi:hypothetical protein
MAEHDEDLDGGTEVGQADGLDAESSEDSPTSGDDSAPTDDERDDADDAPVGRSSWSLSARNRFTPGRLVFHHRARDIVVPADGDAAMRVIGWFSRAELHPVADFVAARYSDARNGWTTVDLADVVGVTWTPSTLPEGERVVFDPNV